MELQKTIVIQVDGQSYTIPILTPGQIVEIESLKSQLTDGQYGKMSQSSNLLTDSALNYVDVVSTFTVLLPDLKTNLRVKSLFDIPLTEMEVLVREYKKFLTWWLGWIKQMRNLPDTEEKA